MKMEIGQNRRNTSLIAFSGTTFIVNRGFISLSMRVCRVGESPSGICILSSNEEGRLL